MFHSIEWHGLETYAEVIIENVYTYDQYVKRIDD